jgi:ATP-dependent Clp protease ATP-binding subunit ClpC
MLLNVGTSALLVLLLTLHGSAQEKQDPGIGGQKNGFSPRGELPPMLEDYSQRAKRVLFFARLQAGKDGARAIDVDCLLQALIIEDQGGGEELTRLLGASPLAGTIEGRSIQSRSKPFFSTEVARQLVSRIRELSSPSQPLPTAEDIPMSAEVAHALKVASDLRKEFQAERVGPLHLLAAALQERSKGADRVFPEYGITQERVLEALGGGE